MPTTIILHGYSDEADNFKPLAAYLRANAITPVAIHLGNYISLEDTVTIADLAKAFQSALTLNNISTGPGDLNLIVHSTGSLVAREWMARYFLELDKPCPVKRFLMLAPANFGSPLASMGKTMLGRIIKGWKSGFESGREVLNALEMGSSYTRELARRDLFGPKSFYDPAQCMAAVLVGSKPYQEGLRQIVDKKGTDGTVYVCTANLNATGVTVRFGHRNEETKVTPWPRTAQPMSFGVFADRDHSSITRPDSGKKDLGKFIVDFLTLETSDEYGRFKMECEALTKSTLPLQPAEDKFHSYQNLVTTVTDDLGIPVKDYFLEFYEKAKGAAEEQKIDSLMIKIHAEVLEDVHTFGPDPSHRSLIFDLTDLRETLAKTKKKLMFSLSAAPLSRMVSFKSTKDLNDVSELAVHGVEGGAFWRDNQTMLADLMIQREQAEDVFKIVAG